jgi:hypothetical protein
MALEGFHQRRQSRHQAFAADMVGHRPQLRQWPDDGSVLHHRAPRLAHPTARPVLQDLDGIFAVITGHRHKLIQHSTLGAAVRLLIAGAQRLG